MKIENIVTFITILIFGMTLGAITSNNIKDQNKNQIDTLEKKLLEIQEANLDLIKENFFLQKTK